MLKKVDFENVGKPKHHPHAPHSQKMTELQKGR